MTRHSSRQPGAPRERTSLAWSRTTLSYAACATLLARLATTASTAGAVLAAVGILVAVGLLAAGELRRTSAPAGGPALPRPVVGPVSLALLAAGTVVLGGCALTLIYG